MILKQFIENIVKHSYLEKCIMAKKDLHLLQLSPDLNLQDRDILKKHHNEAHLAIRSLGIENQPSIDKNMPACIIVYDAGTY